MMKATLRAIGLILLMLTCGIITAVFATFVMMAISTLLTGYYDAFGELAALVFIALAFSCGCVLPLAALWKRLGDE